MPIAQLNDAAIEYYVEGEGPPLLMIMGLGGQASSWGQPFLTVLQKHFTTIRLSNRGTGRSSGPAATSIRLMADDAAALTRHAGYQSVHVLGISMGGMIAQEFVLNHPRLVQGLVLGCTNCGPAHSVRPEASLLAAFAGLLSLPMEQRLAGYWEAAVTPEFVQRAPEFLAGIVASGLENPTSPETFFTQTMAIQMFDSFERLPQISVPVLIIQGDRDVLVPAQNAQILHERISGSRVRVIPGVGHCFFWENVPDSAGGIIEFLAGVPAAA